VRAGSAEHLQHLPLRRGRCVGGAKSDRHRTGTKPGLEAPPHLRYFGVAGGLACRRSARQEAAGVVHHRHAHGDVADGDPVVNQLARLALAVPAVDVGRAHLELEHAGHPVLRGMPVVLRVLAVPMQVDEPRREDQPAPVDAPAALKRTRFDRGDRPAADADLAGRIEPRFRVHHPRAVDDEIEVRRLRGRRLEISAQAGHGGRGDQRQQ
jgi:hypothetical protein